ncbi:MAG: NUDIX domain-containing protein [Bacteroides sp.]|nr:NUDIX domain-containing protein [Eubacterium sp.]MCM1419348.1 NUDIX domain-containing protein [Roseburia sp.]MCM1463186.1 NUDIX domain-containing protein [Bacteroides sp.]
MRSLFEIDEKDYKEGGTVGTRPSVRGIIIRDGKIAMIHSLKYNYYKLPGGGAEEGEDQIDTLIREVKEESGLNVIRSSVRAFGYVRRIQKGDIDDIFIQDNFYYLCEAEETTGVQKLDDYEQEERFTLEFVTPQVAIDVNQNEDHGEKWRDPHGRVMIEREIKVLRILISELFSAEGETARKP